MNIRMNSQFPFVIRYAVLDSHLIFNECGPQSAGPRGWDVEAMQKRQAAMEKWIAALNRKNGFYDKLEASILEHGVRNPILVTAGYCRENKLRNLPVPMQKDPRRIIFCGSNGGSRLWVAQKHNMQIPCIISDFLNVFPDAKVLHNEQDIMQYYKDKPKKVKINVHGVAVSSLPQIHLI